MPPLLTEEESLLEPYILLGIGTTATEKEIRKAYRRQSLKYHPDRNSAPEAAVKFREISLSLELLIDPAKRQYVDTKLEGERRRKEKYAELDKKRKVMVDALNQREEDAKKAKVEAVKRRQQAAEEERIQEDGRRMVEEAQKRVMAAASSSTPSQNGANHAGPSRSNGTSVSEPQPPISSEDLTIILQFPPSSSLPSTSEALQPVLEARYGPISLLIINEPPETAGKKKKKGRKAVVEFQKGNWGGCWACWKDHLDSDSEGGKRSRRLEEGVKARWVKGEVPAWVAWADRQQKSLSNGTNGHAHEPDRLPIFNSAPNLSSTSMADLMAEHAGRKETKKKEEEYESMTLFKMRQAERIRLEEEIRRQEEDES